MKDSKNGKTMGVFVKDNCKSAFVEAWKAALKKEDFESVSIVVLLLD